jgi:hypothetical protein
MSCSICGQTYCSGNCMVGQIQQTVYQNQVPQWIQIQNPSLAGGAGGGGAATTLIGGTVVDNTVYNFLEVIADKSDTDACVAFLEKQRTIRIKQIQEIERLQKQFLEDLEEAEQEFLSKCQKYRPSITNELLNRIKKLKAFF